MNDDNIVMITKAEHQRLLDCEKAWCAVVDALHSVNVEIFAKPLTGIECALVEIKRLQAVREG